MVRNRWVLASTVVVLMLLSVSCSDPSAPFSATPQGSLVSLNAGLDSVGLDPRAEHERLLQRLKQVKDSLKAERERHRDEFREASAQWKEFQKQWKRDKKNGAAPALLTCQPQEYAADAELIGPNGGTIKLGANELRIPKGALDHEVIITGVAPVSDLVEVDFQPEGLRFQVPAELKLDYSHCVAPSWLNLFIVYLSDDGNQVLGIQPSVDKKGLKAVYGDLYHFSRYAVAW